MKTPRGPLRLPAWIAAQLYTAGLYADRLLDGLRRRYRADIPVIGVGNPALGGSGKTPLAARLAAGLSGRGLKAALVTRGYGGEAARRSSEPLVVSRGAGPLVPAKEAGDEAVWLAERLPGSPVVCGRIKARATLLAATLPGVEAVIVDDALQHRRLHRDFDIAVLPAADWRARLGGAAHPPPLGRFRAPFDELRRTDALVLLGSHPDELAALRRRFPEPLCLAGRFHPDALVNHRGKRLALAELAGRPVVAFAGIARPAVFFADLERLGAELVARLPLPDHADYDVVTLRRLDKLLTAHPEALPVTTGKDAVKLTPGRIPKLVWLERRLELDAAGLLDRLTAVINAHPERPGR